MKRPSSVTQVPAIPASGRVTFGGATLLVLMLLCASACVQSAAACAGHSTRVVACEASACDARREGPAWPMTRTVGGLGRASAVGRGWLARALPRGAALQRVATSQDLPPPRG